MFGSIVKPRLNIKSGGSMSFQSARNLMAMETVFSKMGLRNLMDNLDGICLDGQTIPAIGTVGNYKVRGGVANHGTEEYMHCVNPRHLVY